MNADNESGFLRFLKFTAFVLLLWVVYYAFLTLLLFFHGSLGFESVRLFRSYFLSTDVSPYLLFLILVVSMQWLRWLYALYQKRDESDLFVENYFLPIFYGSACSLFVVAPLIYVAFDLLFLSFGLHSGHFSLSEIWVAPFLLMVFNLPLFFLIFLLVLMSGRFKKCPRDLRLAETCIAGSLLTATLNFYAYSHGRSDTTPLCDLSGDYYGTTLMISIAFFKGTELAVRPCLSNGFKPHHTAFAIPACLVMLVMFYVSLLSGMDALCYDWGSHNDPISFNVTAP